MKRARGCYLRCQPAGSIRVREFCHADPATCHNSREFPQTLPTPRPTARHREPRARPHRVHRRRRAGRQDHAQQLDLDDKTVKEHTLLLEQLFLVKRLGGWRPGLGAREAARPKAYLCDTGLLAHLLGADEARIRNDDQVKGKGCETLVFAELIKHAAWAEQDVRLVHYQRDREDIDFIIENNAGEIAAIEVKASATIDRRDRRWLEHLRDARPSSFKAGIVIHTGPQTTPLGDRLWAMPFSGLWA
jgi:uncharacterized protein